MIVIGFTQRPPANRLFRRFPIRSHGVLEVPNGDKRPRLIPRAVIRDTLGRTRCVYVPATLVDIRRTTMYDGALVDLVVVLSGVLIVVGDDELPLGNIPNLVRLGRRSDQIAPC